MLGTTFLRAAMMYGMAIVISFMVALLVKAIFMSIRFFKQGKEAP